MSRPLDASVVERPPATTSTAPSEAALDELRREILRVTRPILAGAGIPSGRTACRLELEATGVNVRFDLPVAVTRDVKRALAVRVLDAVRGARRTYGPLQVTVCDEDEV